jgi:SAM-dependent methyltransferase
MSYQYDTQFFDFVNVSAGKSANRFVITLVDRVFSGKLPESVWDVGCGRGVWLATWRKQGVENMRGVDGDYIDTSTLVIPHGEFIAADISNPLKLGERFELVQCLEVAEHLPPESADNLVDSLVRHGNVILFSAATPGQGGEFHVNEQPFEYWQAKFEARGYRMYDAIRPAVRTFREIEPWYRYNSFIYANQSGIQRLSQRILATLVPAGQKIPHMAPAWWRVRCYCLSMLPKGLTFALARLKHRAANVGRSRTAGRC